MRTFFPDSERGSVLSLNGDGDYVDCGHHPILDLTDAMSVSCWVTVASLERSHYLVSKGRAISWNCWASQVAGNIGFRCIGLSSGERPDRATVKGTARIDDGLWHHIACVYDGKQIRIHIDGSLDSCTPARGKIFRATSPVYIGSNHSRPGQEWNGRIDDVRLFNYALTASEVKVLYENNDSRMRRR